MRRRPRCQGHFESEAHDPDRLRVELVAIEDGRITAIYVVRNPDKLRQLH
jgi:hypothetical protein